MPTQTINIPLARSIDTEGDPKTTEGMSFLENAEVLQSGEIRKRCGFARMPNSIAAPGVAGVFNVKTGAAIFDFKGSPVVLGKIEHIRNATFLPSLSSGHYYRVFDHSAGVWRLVGETDRLRFEQKAVLSGVRNQGRVSRYALGATKNLLACAYVTNQELWITAQDEQGTVVATKRLDDTITADPDLFECFGMLDGSFCVAWYAAAIDDRIIIYKWDPQTNVRTFVNVTTTATTTFQTAHAAYLPSFDSHGATIATPPAGRDAVVVFYTESTEILHLALVDSDLNVFASDPALNPIGGDAVNKGRALGLLVHYHEDPSDVVLPFSKIWVLTVFFSLSTSANTLHVIHLGPQDGDFESKASGTFDLGKPAVKIGAAPTDFTFGGQIGYVIAAHYGSGATTTVDYLRIAKNATIGLISSSASVQEARGVHQIEPACPFTLDGQFYIPLAWLGAGSEVVQRGTILRSVKVLRDFATAGLITASMLVARRGQGAESYDYQAVTAPHRPIYLPDGRVLFLTQREDRSPIILLRGPFEGVTMDTAWSVLSAIAVYASAIPPPPNSVAALGGIIIGGASVGWFDGEWQELGFHLFPTAPTDGGDVAAGGLSAGVYSYQLSWEWFDRVGNAHRSAPSLATLITCVVGHKRTIHTRAVSTMHPYSKRSNIRLLLWRTEHDGSIHHLEQISVSGIPQLMSTTDGAIVDMTSTATDAVVRANEILGADGGELDAVAPPSAYIMTARRDRVFLVPDEDRVSIWPSKPLLAGRGPEFSDSIALRFDAGGPINALAVMDEQVLVFKGQRIDVFGGQGPNSLGQGAFSEPRSVASDTGCLDHLSLVVCSKGCLFKSSKGWMLLSRDLTLDERIGMPIRAYDHLQVRATVLLETRNQIRIMLASKTMLTLDITHGLWSTTTLEEECAHAASVGGVFMWVSQSGVVHTELQTRGQDSQTPYGMKVGTPWVKPGPLGEMRVLRIGILGDYKSPTKIKASILYDYNETAVVETRILDTKEAKLEKGAMMLEFVPVRTRCRSFKLILEDQGLGEGIALSALAVDIRTERALGRSKPKGRF